VISDLRDAEQVVRDRPDAIPPGTGNLVENALIRWAPRSELASQEFIDQGSHELLCRTWPAQQGSPGQPSGAIWGPPLAIAAVVGGVETRSLIGCVCRRSRFGRRRHPVLSLTCSRHRMSIPESQVHRLPVVRLGLIWRRSDCAEVILLIACDRSFEDNIRFDTKVSPIPSSNCFARVLSDDIELARCQESAPLSRITAMISAFGFVDFSLQQIRESRERKEHRRT
jgi:hypothetical protein